MSIVSNPSTQNFMKDMNNFRHSSNLVLEYEEWKATPIPEEFLNDQSSNVVRLRVIDSGVDCFEKAPQRIDKYSEAYWSALKTPGAYYSYVKNSDNSFIMFLPQKKLLFHTIF